jgi:hypothetical protein
MWHLGSADNCPSDMPVAVIKTADGSVAGCHSTREDANAQMAVLYASEDGIGHQPSGVETDLPDCAADDPSPYAISSGQVAMGEQVLWQNPPIAFTTPTSQVW